MYKPRYIHYITNITNETIFSGVRGRVKAKQNPGVSAMPVGLILNDGTWAFAESSLFPSSSVVEQLTVNQLAGGSKPSWGAKYWMGVRAV